MLIRAKLADGIIIWFIRKKTLYRVTFMVSELLDPYHISFIVTKYTMVRVLPGRSSVPPIDK